MKMRHILPEISTASCELTRAAQRVALGTGLISILAEKLAEMEYQIEEIRRSGLGAQIDDIKANLYLQRNKQDDQGRGSHASNGSI